MKKMRWAAAQQRRQPSQLLAPPRQLLLFRPYTNCFDHINTMVVRRLKPDDFLVESSAFPCAGWGPRGAPTMRRLRRLMHEKVRDRPPWAAK